MSRMCFDRPTCWAVPGQGLPQGSGRWGYSGQKMPCANVALAVEQSAGRGPAFAWLGAAGQLPVWEKLAKSLARQAIRKCLGGNETSYVIAPVAGQPHVFLRFSVPDEET